MMKKRILISLLFGMTALSCLAQTETIDEMILGNKVSEECHALSSEGSEIIIGGLDEPARRLLPLSPASWDGGAITFTMKVDPDRQNYVTARLWGSDFSTDTGHNLVLYADGKQVGYRRESDYDLLNATETEPQAPGRFFYETRPLPISMTKGKTSISLKIAALGSIYNYGDKWEKYQRILNEPTRGIYCIYTHTGMRFEPSPSEKQGAAPKGRLHKSAVGSEVIAKSKDIVIKRLSKILESQPDQQSRNLGLLSEAYNVAWTPAYKNPVTIEHVVFEGDRLAELFAANSEYTGGWMGTAALGEAIMRTWPEIGKYLDSPFKGKINGKTRREVWSMALKQSIEYWRTHRRGFTNQSMLVDGGIYRSNRGLALINPSMALPEEQALRYVREAVGAEPWRDSDIISQSDDRPANYNGDRHYLVSRKGLSRELGWVGSYGETILTITSELAEITGDEMVRRQLAKLQNARLVFRYPYVDADGNYGMKLSAEIDGRHSHYPLRGMAYAAPQSIREHWGMETASMFPDDRAIVGATQRFISDGYYFEHIQKRLKDSTLGLMRNINEYEKVKDLQHVPYKFPMEDGQPDFVFADEENAVIAVKHGDTRLFMNLYFRSENAVNNVAKIMEITPAMTRLVTAKIQSEVIGNGEFYTRPDYMDWIRGDAPYRTPPGQKIHQAWAGEKMPISTPPGGQTHTGGKFGHYVGRAAFYWLEYGDYLIGLNTTEKHTYTLPVTRDCNNLDLVTGKNVTPENGGVKVGPLSTVVLVSKRQ